MIFVSKMSLFGVAIIWLMLPRIAEGSKFCPIHSVRFFKGSENYCSGSGENVPGLKSAIEGSVNNFGCIKLNQFDSSVPSEVQFDVRCESFGESMTVQFYN